MGYTSTWISSLSQIRGAVPSSLPHGLPLPSFPGPLASYGMPHACQYNPVGAASYPVQWVGISGAPQQSVVLPTQSGGLFQPGMNRQSFPAPPVQNPGSIPPGPKWVQVSAEGRGENFQNTCDATLSSWVLPYFLSFISTLNCVFCCSNVIFDTAHHSVVMCNLHKEYCTQKCFFTSNPILFDTWFLKNPVPNALLAQLKCYHFQDTSPVCGHALTRPPSFLCCYQQLYDTSL